MDESSQNVTHAADPSEAIANRLTLEGRFKSGANWFYWIAALSLINSIVAVAGGGISFIVGLGVTQIFDGIAISLTEASRDSGLLIKGLSMGANLVAITIFALFGYLSNRRLTWAFIVGMVLYAIDGLIMLAFREWLSLGFHLFALWGIFGGFQALKQLLAFEGARRTANSGA